MDLFTAAMSAIHKPWIAAVNMTAAVPKRYTTCRRKVRLYSLVIQILRVVGLGKEEPAFGQ